MSEEWYIGTDDGKFGPVSFEDLAAAARAGRIQPNSSVRNGLEGEWIRAGQVIPEFLGRPISGWTGMNLRTATSIAIIGISLALLMRLGWFVYELIWLAAQIGLDPRILLNMGSFLLQDALAYGSLLIFLLAFRARQSK